MFPLDCDNVGSGDGKEDELMELDEEELMVGGMGCTVSVISGFTEEDSILLLLGFFLEKERTDDVNLPHTVLVCCCCVSVHEEGKARREDTNGKRRHGIPLNGKSAIFLCFQTC